MSSPGPTVSANLPISPARTAKLRSAAPPPAGTAGRRAMPRRPILRPRARPRRAIRCYCISPRAPPRNQSWCCIAIRVTRSGICRRCIGSACRGDVHLNISSPGWAKHAYSCVFAPWNAGATVLMVNQARFDARRLLDAIVGHRVTTFCAPPTVWRMLIQEDLSAWKVGLREVVGAGEPLNPEVIEQVRAAWGLTVRDGYGQTETTLQVGNFPGQNVKPGAMGKPAPGYGVRLLDNDGTDCDEGELCLALDPPPLGLMQGYQRDDGSLQPLSGAIYRTGDVAMVDGEGYLTYVGRADDVFKASDYRISPFELESALIEHPAVAEAAVVPSPDPLRLAVPKAFIALAADHPASRDTALAIFRHIRAHLAPFKRVRRIEFAELPKTISGKIRRVELRSAEAARQGGTTRAEREFWEDDFPELR